MTGSAGRILTTHAGSLPRSEMLRDLVLARAEGKRYDPQQLATLLRDGVRDVVRRQVACGLDSVNDGELGKTNFTNYVRERLSGFEARPAEPGKGPPPLSIAGRDLKKFPEYFAADGRGFGGVPGYGPRRAPAYCGAALKIVGHHAPARGAARFKARTQRGTGA